MTDHVDLTRRQAIAALGTIGAVSAGAGMGTSAYLSDDEPFLDSVLTAGALDLKVAWEEHYADLRADELEQFGGSVKRVGGDPSAVPNGHVGLPTASDPVVAVPEGDREQFGALTAVEAFPDVNDDGRWDPFAARPGETTDDGVGYVCADGADVPDDLDPRPDGALRTASDDTYDAAADAVKPVFALDDVKPGDFGAATLRFHLCDNPGYVWLRGAVVENAENGVIEPERGAPGEDDQPGDAETTGELLDAIRTAVWYDDGDGVFDPGEETITAVSTASLRDLLALLSTGPGIQLCPGGTGGAGGACPENADYDSRHATGETVTLASGSTFTIPMNPKCADFGLIEAMKTDEAPEGNLPQSGTTTYQTAYGDVTITTADRDGVQTVTDWSFESDRDFCVAKLIVKGGSEGANVYSYDNDDGDDDFSDGGDAGAMGDADTDLTTPTGQEISHLDVGLVPAAGGDGCCFEPSTDHHVGFAWWLPEDTGNAVQTDSVAFDLGFYTEQCRHNERPGSTVGGSGS